MDTILLKIPGLYHYPQQKPNNNIPKQNKRNRIYILDQIPRQTIYFSIQILYKVTSIMTRFFSFIPYLWIPFIVISRVVGTSAFQGFGLSRIIPTAFIYSPLFSKRDKILYVPPTIIPEEEEPMDHGELEWDFPPEKTPNPPIMPDTTNSTFPQHITILTGPFVVKWFRTCLDEYFRGTYIYKEHDDPFQIIFIFV
jgi:hypothetical protein